MLFTLFYNAEEAARQSYLASLRFRTLQFNTWGKYCRILYQNAKYKRNQEDKNF